MRLLDKLRHPVILVGQGFVLGGALFFSSQPVAETVPVAPQHGSILATVAPLS